MKVYVLNDGDLQRLRDQLKLKENKEVADADGPAALDAIRDTFRAVNYVVECWIQEIAK